MLFVQREERYKHAAKKLLENLVQISNRIKNVLQQRSYCQKCISNTVLRPKNNSYILFLVIQMTEGTQLSEWKKSPYNDGGQKDEELSVILEMISYPL
jgi:hypothetical protein